MQRGLKVHASPLQFPVISCACKDSDQRHDLVCARGVPTMTAVCAVLH